MAYLGLDWSNEEVDTFVQSRGSCGLLQFMSTFVKIIEEVRAALAALSAFRSAHHSLCACRAL